MRLRWPCDGKCGKMLEEGCDYFYILEIVTPGSVSEGECIRLCEACAGTQLRTPEED